MEVNKITMEEAEVTHEREEVPQLQLHEHPLIPFTRFEYGRCEGCSSSYDDHHAVASLKKFYIYGGYRCNELGCDKVLFHKECAKPLQEINHSSHPDHPLKLIIQDSQPSTCFCGKKFKVGYSCTICDFKLDLECARRQEPLFLPVNSYGHEHQLKLVTEPSVGTKWKTCKVCQIYVNKTVPSHYRCQKCEDYAIHVDCVCFSPEGYHTSHPQHPLKSLKCQVPDYADEKCLLCGTKFDKQHHQIHHCDVCNFSICRACMKNPPPVDLECVTTHEHRLHLFPRRMDFTCNACGTLGDRSPYICHQCNFMIHRECIGLPRVININRHDHRISYTPRLGHGEWKCKVCRKKVDGFYGAYSCSKCPPFAVHSKCATRKDVWDMVEREGTPEEEEEEEIIAPFEVIDDNTIKHFSHDHNLQINKDDVMMILPESTLCVACVLHIFSEPFYSCKQCDFVIHEKCANLSRRKRHMRNNKPFTLRTDSHKEVAWCKLCHQYFTGFRYESGPYLTLDVRCASATDTLVHESHPHPLHYYSKYSHSKPCSRCGDKYGSFRCDECDYILDGKCALLPEKVMRNRYDDHPLFLSYGERRSVDGEYWCEVCETKVDPKRGFYTCNDCGVFLHISCVVGVFSYIMRGSSVSCCAVRVREVTHIELRPVKTSSNEEVVSNTSICRPLCFVCNSRYKLPSILKVCKDGVDVYVCSLKCCRKLFKE